MKLVFFSILERKNKPSKEYKAQERVGRGCLIKTIQLIIQHLVTLRRPMETLFRYISWFVSLQTRKDQFIDKS